MFVKGNIINTCVVCDACDIRNLENTFLSLPEAKVISLLCTSGICLGGGVGSGGDVCVWR